jgi:hypothetical protein
MVGLDDHVGKRLCLNHLPKMQLLVVDMSSLSFQAKT